MSDNQPSNPAPQIPNLLDALRVARAERPARRSNPRKPPSQAAATQSSRISTNEVIASTDYDAASSRLSAVRAGWLKDPYADQFCPDSDISIKKMPIINRGTYVRTKAVDELVLEFLSSEGQKSGTDSDVHCQVLSLGAGTDTRWPRFLNESCCSELVTSQRLRWVEVDFPETMDRKRRLLQKLACAESTGWRGVGMDLRELCDGVQGIKRLKGAVLSDAPTLILSEMCLSYLQPQDSTSILQRIATVLLPEATPLKIVLYEPLQPTDAFGRTMVKNLSSRGIELPGFLAFETLEAHAARLVNENVSFEGWGGMSVGKWWDTRIASEEKDRLRTVEMVDEEEEWILLAAHYGLIWAWRGAGP